MSESTLRRSGSETIAENEPIEQPAANKDIPASIAERYSFSIWPPTQKTRDAVISRLVESLTTESVLSKRYGTIPDHEASDVARRIEEEAFGAVDTGAAPAAGDRDIGMETLQAYSKEISKRMLETMKLRAEPNVVKEEKAVDAAKDAPSEEAVNAED